MKARVTLNWVHHYAELTPAELDIFNKVLSRLRQIKDETSVENRQFIELDPKGAEFKITVLPETTETNQGE